jgi:molecular chaperone GrpE
VKAPRAGKRNSKFKNQSSKLQQKIKMTKNNIKNEENLEEAEKPDVEEVAEESEPIVEDSELEQLGKKLEDAEASYKRALADYQNLQKRVAEERRNLIMSANQDLLLKILSIFDTLVLANLHDQSEGLKVSITQFLDILKSEGVTKIETEGREFDPHLMEAVAIEKGEDNKVLEELRAGFMLNDKVLRVAQVKVGKE